MHARGEIDPGAGGGQGARRRRRQVTTHHGDGEEDQRLEVVVDRAVEPAVRVDKSARIASFFSGAAPLYTIDGRDRPGLGPVVARPVQQVRQSTAAGSDVLTRLAEIVLAAGVSADDVG